MDKSNKVVVLGMPQPMSVLNLANGQTPSALVGVDLLKRIVASMPEAPFGDISRRLISRIDDSTTLDQMLTIIEEEAAFHRGIQAIQAIDAKPEKKERVGQPAV